MPADLAQETVELETLTVINNSSQALTFDKLYLNDVQYYDLITPVSMTVTPGDQVVLSRLPSQPIQLRADVAMDRLWQRFAQNITTVRLVNDWTDIPVATEIKSSDEGTSLVISAADKSTQLAATPGALSGPCDTSPLQFECCGGDPATSYNPTKNCVTLPCWIKLVDFCATGGYIDGKLSVNLKPSAAVIAEAAGLSWFTFGAVGVGLLTAVALLAETEADTIFRVFFLNKVEGLLCNLLSTALNKIIRRHVVNCDAPRLC